MVLSSFFWGYVVTQVPSGYIATIWSGQKLLAIGMLICGIFKVLTPIVASWGLWAVLVCRVGMGLTQACLLPCIQTLLSKWAPPAERARLGENRFRFCARLYSSRIKKQSNHKLFCKKYSLNN